MNENMELYGARGLKSERFGGMNLRNRLNPDKTPENPYTAHHNCPLETQRLELGIPVRTGEWSNHCYSETANYTYTANSFVFKTDDRRTVVISILMYSVHDLIRYALQRSV